MTQSLDHTDFENRKNQSAESVQSNFVNNEPCQQMMTKQMV